MDARSSPRRQPPSSARRKNERRVAESSDEAPAEQDSSDADAVMTTSRRPSSSAKSRSSNNILNGLQDEVDENEDPDATPPPPSAPSSNSKRRRVSVSGRAAATTSTPTGQQRRRAVAEKSNGDDDDDDDEEEEEDGDTPPPEPSMTASHGDHHSRDVQVDPLMADEAAEAKEKKHPMTKTGNTLVRDDKDGYVMGSIVRIKCHNFLTYYDTECYPGPHLNMIFGPNGSGKSSLVAAIALGLGFPPKVMQRAKHLKEFIKRGETEGFVEIELKGRPGKRNLVVRRSFQVENNRSSYDVNGKPATAALVAESVRALHVNVDNLCAFLPQDRVSEFAKMTGPELLRETQRTANERLLDQQTQLAELKAQLTEVDKNLGRNKTTLQENERKMASLDKDVRRYNERQSLLDEVELERLVHPYAMYREAKEKHAQLRRDRNEIKERLDSLTDQHAPLLEQAAALKSLLKQAEARKKGLSQKRDELGRAHKKVLENVAHIETKVARLRESLNQIKADEQTHRVRLHETQRKIRDLTKKIEENPPPSGDAPEISARSEELRAKFSALRDEIYDVQAQNKAVNGEIDAANKEKNGLQTQLSSLNNVQARRDEQCKKEDPNLWTATTFVRQTRGKFRDTVYDPIRLLVGVKDKRHARVAEAAINYTNMKTFVCLDRDDYGKLRQHLQHFPTPRGQADLRVNLAELPAARRDLAQYTAPCTQEQLQGLGFDAFVLDLLDGPPDVLAYLCYTSGIHRIPVAFDEGSRIDHVRMRSPNTPFKRYISQYTVTDINFSRYGNREAVVSDLQTKDPRIFNEAVDQNRKQELEMKIAQIEASVTDAQERRDELVSRDDALQAEGRTVKEQRDAIDAERKQIQEARKQFEHWKVDLRTAQKHLRELEARPSEANRRKEIAGKMKVLALEKLRITRTLEPLADQLLKCHALEASPLFAHLEAGATLRALESSLQGKSRDLQTIREDFEIVNRQEKDAKVAAKSIFENANVAATKVPPHMKETFEERVGSLDEPADVVLERISDLESRLEVSQHINAGVIRKFEELQRSVEVLRTKVQESEEFAEKGRAEVEEVHNRWYPQVLEIVEKVGTKFSRAMQSLGCVGEVSIAENEDYSNWAISIKVAFRDGEKVAELNPHRQSGGERSLTTMMYLISLLELSKVPFSLVDEINQGMDARAERAVHNHLVNAVCDHPDVGQYFLLTPKLLTNLNYHARIKILCVNNGEWLPDDGLPLRSIINKRLAAKTGSRSGRSNRA